MADLAIAVLYAQELISKYGASIAYACKVAGWEYGVDSHRVFRLVTE
jgi:hypothetical protein